MGLVKKPTGFTDSSRYIIEEMGKKRNGDRSHVPLAGGRAAWAAVYPQAWREAICRGVARQKKLDHRLLTSMATGCMTEGEVKRSANHICSLQDKGASSIGRILSTHTKDGVNRPVGEA